MHITVCHDGGRRCTTQELAWPREQYSSFSTFMLLIKCSGERGWEGGGSQRYTDEFLVQHFTDFCNKLDFSMSLEKELSITEEWTSHMDNLNALVMNE